MSEFTSDQIMQGISAAIREHDFEAVVSLIKLLALQDPEQAELVYESMRAVLAARMVR